MTANITLGSIAVGSTGKVATATISGGSGSGYTISSVLGLVPKLNVGPKLGFVVSTASVSGSTLTMTLANTVGTGESIQFDITTDSTLTDSASNTVTGQTNVAVTNGSTVTVAMVNPVTNPKLFELLGMYQPADFGIGGISINAGVPSSSYNGDWPLEFVADATEVSILTLNGSSTYAIDGGTTGTAVGNPAANWQIKPLATGLTAGKHLVQVVFDSYFLGARVAGSAAALTTVATTKNTIVAQSSGYVALPAATAVTVWGERQLGADYPGAIGVSGNYTGTVLEFGFNGSGFELLTVASPYSKWAVSRDGGQPGALVSVANDGGFCLSPLVEGLDSGSHTVSAMQVAVGTNTTLRYVRIINGTRLASAASAGATSIAVASASTLKVGDWVKIGKYAAREWRQITALSGTTATVAALASAHAAGTTVTSYEAPAATISVHTRDRTAKRLAALGDSNTEGANDFGGLGTTDPDGNYYAVYDPRRFPGFLAADPHDYEIMNLGIQGTTTAQIAVNAFALTDYALASFDYLTVWAGTNDLNGSGSTYTPVQYKADVQTILNAAIPMLRAGGKIVLMPPLTPPPEHTTTGGLSFAVAATQLAALAAANPTTVVFASDIGVDLVNADSNGVHYHPTGQVKIAARLAPYIGLGGSAPGVYLGAVLLVAF